MSSNEKILQIKQLVGEIKALCEGTDAGIVMVCEDGNIDIDFLPDRKNPRCFYSRVFVGCIRKNSPDIRYDRIIRKLQKIKEERADKNGKS